MATYYVQPNGKDTNTGLGTGNNRAWKTIYKATTTAVAGDIVNIMAGTYTENDSNAGLRAKRSGSAGLPITFQNYGTDVVNIKHRYSGASIFYSYITLKGLNFINDSQSSGMGQGILHWGTSFISNIIIDGCTVKNIDEVENPNGIRLEACNDSVIRNCSVDYVGIAPQPGPERGNAIWVYGDGNLVENCITNHSGHSGLFLLGDKNIVRNCEFIGSWGVCGEYLAYQDLTQHNLVENCIFRDASMLQQGLWYNPAWCHMGSGTIFRRNRIYNGIGAGIQFYSRSDYQTKYTRNYHNIIYNCGYGTAGRQYDMAPYELNEEVAGTMGDNIVKNSIHYSNKSSSQITCAGNATSADITLSNNTWNATNPLFVNAPTDFTLLDTSSCINAGGWLTTITTASGSGTSFTVADPKYLCSGWGISGVLGDEVQVQGQTDTARVTDVNYTTGLVTVSASLTWTQNYGLAIGTTA